MTRTKTVIYYIVSTLISIIALITFIKLPKIIFIGMEDFVLSILFYILAILGICSFSINIVDFFLVRLGIYGLIKIESDKIKYRIEQIETKQKTLKNGIFKNKIEIIHIKEGN